MAKKKIPRYLGSSPAQPEGIISYLKKLVRKVIGIIK